MQPGAPDFTKGVADAYREKTKELLGRAPNDASRGYLAQRLADYEERFISAAKGIEAEEGVRNRVRLNEKSIDGNRLQVRTQPDSFLERLAETRATLNASALPPAERDRLDEYATQGLAVDALIGKAKQDPEKVLMALYAAPGESGDPAVEVLTPKGRDQMLRYVQGEFAALVNAQEQQARMEEAERKRIHQDNDRIYTAAAIRGQLSGSDLARALDYDALSPETARTLRNVIKENSGEGVTTNAEKLYLVSTNLLSLTEEEIESIPDISWTDKLKLVEDMRKRQSGWPSTPEAKEAIARIDRELGIQTGINAAPPTVEDMKRRGQALTAFYNRVQTLPADQRQSGAIAEAAIVIETVLTDQRSKQRQRVENQLATLSQKDVSSMGASERAVHDRTVQTLQQKLRELQK